MGSSVRQMVSTAIAYVAQAVQPVVQTVVSQVILLWDGLPSHRSLPMQQFLAEQKDWPEVRRLPGYAPELNPAERFWANLKSRELADRCETRVKTLGFVARLGADRVRGDRCLLFGFFRQTGLTLGSVCHAL